MAPAADFAADAEGHRVEAAFGTRTMVAGIAEWADASGRRYVAPSLVVEDHPVASRFHVAYAPWRDWVVAPLASVISAMPSQRAAAARRLSRKARRSASGGPVPPGQPEGGPKAGNSERLSTSLPARRR